MKKPILFWNRRKAQTRKSINAKEVNKSSWTTILNYVSIFSSLVAAFSAIFSVYQFKKSVELSTLTLEQTAKQIQVANDQFFYQRYKDSLDNIEQEKNRL